MQAFISTTTCGSSTISVRSCAASMRRAHSGWPQGCTFSKVSRLAGVPTSWRASSFRYHPPLPQSSTYQSLRRYKSAFCQTSNRMEQGIASSPLSDGVPTLGVTGAPICLEAALDHSQTTLQFNVADNPEL
jgi:hypothetical protein